MKPLLLLALLSSAALLCCAAPAVEPVACTEDGIAAAARLAMQHINKYHRHGYKFRLNQTLDHELEKTDDGCNVELQLGLLETKCHAVNPTPFEDCPLREELARAVMANCSVSMTVKSGEAKVVKYLCDTKQEKSNEEMVTICPDCFSLLPLNNTEGLKAAAEAVKTFNTNTSNQNYYILKEVGRISSGYMMMSGMSYHVELALVETFCPMGSRIVIEACKARCPDRARHAFCSTSYSSTNGLGSVECEFYPPQNTTALGPNENEMSCWGHHHHPHGHGPPPHAHDHGHGPPPHAHGQGPPPHANNHGQGGNDHGRGQGKDHGRGHGQGNDHGRGHGQGNDHGRGHGQGNDHSRGHGHAQGPPPHAHDHEHGHGRWPHHKSFPPCHGFLKNVDPALHPICPWPYPEPKHKPKAKPSHT